MLPSVADLVHRVTDVHHARPLDGVQLSKDGSGFVEVLLSRLAKTIAVKSRRDVTKIAKACNENLLFVTLQQLFTSSGFAEALSCS